MKNTFFPLCAALLLSAAANAQTEVNTNTNIGVATQNNDSAVSTTADANANAAIVIDTDVPEALRGVTSETLRPEHYLPVLGMYQSTGSTANNVTITLDDQNIGIVWIDGLPQGRFKALLKKSPATYKIPAQKSAEGKAVGEGVLYFDPLTNEVSIAIGTKYNDEKPTAPFAAANTKANIYKGTKQGTASSTNSTMTNQQ